MGRQMQSSESETASRQSLGNLEPVVVLVDNKVRDLNVAALIAHHLERLGVTCHLEPLEAFRAVLGAYRPGMIVFNHLNASHLADWSRRLAEMGVLTAVLPNEGLTYEVGARALLSGRFHSAHTDYFFCWNEVHREVLIAESREKVRHVEMVGVPRFDFYFEPWSRIVPAAPPRKSQRPRILFCTNFSFTRFRDRRADADKLLGTWAKLNPAYVDYWGAIESQCRSRQRVLGVLETLLDDERFEILLRPHPNEDASFYQTWLDGLSDARKANILIDATSSITSLILDCDLQISCETCTTAIESWIAKKPTIELIFEKHPKLYKEEHSQPNYQCGDFAELPDMIARHLAATDQSEKRELRARHLQKWCATPDGLSSFRIAKIVAEAVQAKNSADWPKLNMNDFRRALKLKVFRSIGHAYHFDPVLSIKRSLFGQRYKGKSRGYAKSIRPRDVADAREKLGRSTVNPIGAPRS
jgi:surface carbohydrate biosynthesis protein